MTRTITLAALLVIFMLPAAFADELTAIVQQDLAALGYEPGDATGEMSTQTIIAISKFQAENDLEVTGEASPQLAGIIKSKLSPQLSGGSAAHADPAALQAAQQACLQDKVATAQASQKKKRGLGSLLKAATRTAARLGGGGAAQDLSRVSSDIYAADATASDLQSAARDLGLTEDDLEECRNPSM